MNRLYAIATILIVITPTTDAQQALAEYTTSESFHEVTSRLGRETAEAYGASPYVATMGDYFVRFQRDPNASPAEDETVIEETWKIVTPPEPNALTTMMAEHLRDFLAGRMGVPLTILSEPMEEIPPRAILILEEGGGDSGVPGSFAIRVEPEWIAVAGKDIDGMRDGVVRLVDDIGTRQAPYLKRHKQVYRPRLDVRLGAVPRGGTFRDLVFMGYNAAFTGGGNLHALSRSDAIPELKTRRVDGMLEGNRASGASARGYGLKTYAFIDTREKFKEDDPIFAAHPDIRGARTWKADGDFVLCTEHPLVQQYLEESMRGIFENAPDLDGVTLIIGGEGFYHCFMRPHGVAKGHTNCARCEALGPETVVANLCNRLARAARFVNPDAEIIVWPYSAAHVWSIDPGQIPFIEKLEPGVALLTEIEKDEYVQLAGGVSKHLWDYSIHMIGPGEKAAAQIAACERAGIRCYLKSEPELGFEAPRLPHLPCLDRWWDRADALASCGASGAFVFPAFRSNYGTSAAEVPKMAWWHPVATRDESLTKLAARLFGSEAGAHVREAWRLVSEAVPRSPKLPSYYTGPYYLGPAHPMSVDPEAKLPEVFYGLYLFHAEITTADGLKLQPTFMRDAEGDVPIWLAHYRRMETLLAEAVAAMDRGAPLVDDAHRLMFEAEDSSVRWFYHTLRAHANFYESCLIRDQWIERNGKIRPTRAEDLERLRERWIAILEDEQENATLALPLIERDVRLDWYYGSDHTFPHAADMLRAKIEIIDEEIASLRN